MRLSIIMLAFAFIACSSVQDSGRDAYPIKPVNSTEVTLTDNFWLPKIKTVQQTTIPHAIEKCRVEGRFDNFLIAGGKMEGKTRGAMPFDDTDVYKIIEGASYSLAVLPNPDLEAEVDSIISIIAVGQEKDGYLTTWRTIDPHHPPAPWVEPGDRWEYLRMSHELYNAGHMYHAAVAHYRATGKKSFLNIALKNADLLVNTFGSDKITKVPGHQIVETGLIKLYQVTGKKKYLELAKFFLDHRGDPESHELYGAYAQDHKPVIQQDEVVGHAVRAVYMYAGMTDIAAIYQDADYQNAVNNLWQNMVYKKMYITGGIGAKHQGESFGENYELPNKSAYSETCAAIGSVYWNQDLFLSTGDPKFYDVIERTLYNGLISGISLDGKTFFYPNPLEADGEYEFNQGACTRKEWFDCSCCPTNLIRFVPFMPNLIYATEGNDLFVNLYMSNDAKFPVNGTEVGVTQTTNYPWEGSIQITVNPERDTDLNLKLRIPGWARDQVAPSDLYRFETASKSLVQVTVNGEKVDYSESDGYCTISREWQKGDTVEIQLPMEIRRVLANENVEADRNRVAVEYGPFVYCGEEVDNGSGVTNLALSDNTQMKVTRMDNLLGGINVIEGTLANSNRKFRLIPYYAWSNRGIGQMEVWFQRQG